MANLASAMTPPLDKDNRPDFVRNTADPEPEARLPEVSGVSTKIYHYLGVDTPFDPQHRLVTSYILPVPALALFRTLVAIYTLFTALATAVHEGVGSITYFTDLSYWGVTTYFVVSAFHTITFWYAKARWEAARRAGGSLRIEMLEKAYPINGVGRIDVARKKANIDAFGTTLHEDIESELSYGRGTGFEVGSNYPRSLLSKRFSRPLQLAHMLLITTVYSYPLVITTIFWTVLAGNTALADSYSAYVNISKHTLNLVLTQLDLTVLSRTPMLPWWHLVPLVAFMAMYFGIVDITWHRYHVLVYNFFNVQQYGVPLVVLFCIVLVVFAVVSFLIAQLLVLIREALAAKIQKSGGWGSAKAVGVDDDACIPTKRGPGPLGGGGKRSRPGHDSCPLRGRFPRNALTGNRSSGIVVDAVAVHRLTMTTSDVLMGAETDKNLTAFEEVYIPSSRSRVNLVDQDSPIASDADLYRLPMPRGVAV